jgi:hypothetical protein|tara:strand:+ start:3556 stop:3675 length:120 start_codon:yes stop_codon:yes gene_type:complete
VLNIAEGTLPESGKQFDHLNEKTNVVNTDINKFPKIREE